MYRLRKNDRELPQQIVWYRANHIIWVVSRVYIHLVDLWIILALKDWWMVFYLFLLGMKNAGKFRF